MIARDKALHLAGGAAIFALACALEVHDAAALSVACFAGWAKEAYDRAHPEAHTDDGWDAYATAVGGVAAFAGWSLAALAWVS